MEMSVVVRVGLTPVQLGFGHSSLGPRHRRGCRQHRRVSGKRHIPVLDLVPGNDGRFRHWADQYSVLPRAVLPPWFWHW